ncbi:response regulator FixJ [Sphingomonas sp. LHG3406-1]|uniref:response regulator FixJ n=1 Tax=Sphingomonas sp. LHG3406-1 TaxID=2804617 RepID=UPI00261CB08F|nr:response regulator FixJ [Sphingomonas sp. LHG3406-1]
MSEALLVHLVDDDEAVRRSAAFMLKTAGFRVQSYDSGVALLKEVRGLEPGCILLDIRMPEMDGLEVQRALREAGCMLPVIIMTGHGDVPIAVQAMKAGAIEFLEKPFEKASLVAALEHGRERLQQKARNASQAEEARDRLNILTPRERDVLAGLVNGLPNKTIAYDLGISPRTVEIHRANLMDKLEVRSLSEALRIAFAAGLGEDDGGSGEVA